MRYCRNKNMAFKYIFIVIDTTKIYKLQYQIARKCNLILNKISFAFMHMNRSTYALTAVH